MRFPPGSSLPLAAARIGDLIARMTLEEKTARRVALHARPRQRPVRPGHFTVMAGASSGDIRLRGGFDIVGTGGRLEKSAAATGTLDPR
ncbi:MAG: hypothetical protein LBM92_03950 [Opitutaceae bacterium]|jgi:hypothetical protein|nr:hypothetical protein [Opitutaceae bacterium]